MLMECSPNLPLFDPTLPTPPPSDLTDNEEEVLEAYFGKGPRRQWARKVYVAARRVPLYLAAGLSFEAVWPALITTEWLAHNRLEDRIKPKLYRDHIFHPVAVAMLGWELLNDSDEQLREQMGENLRESCRWDYSPPPSYGNDIWKDVVTHAWLVAGLFHDHCYPYEILTTSA